MAGVSTARYGVEGIVKSFGGAKALDGVTLSVAAGEVHCLAGENGSGKSTLIKVMSGVHAPDSGLIRLGENTHSSLTPRLAVQEGVQVIFQDFSLLPNLTVAENIAMPTFISRRDKFISKRETESLANSALETIGIDLDIHAPVAEISIASKQLVAIARAMNLGVKMLFMDEATTALTRKEINKLFKVVEGLRDRGVAIVFVSHKIDEVEEICSSISVLRNGKLAAEGLMKDFDRRKITTAMTGQDILENRIAPALPRDAKKVLEVKNLSSKGAFENISFDVTAGEILGITGLLGSGRSEIAEAIFGEQPVDSGVILVDDQAVQLNSPKASLKAGIGYVPEDRLTQGLFLEQSILRNITAVGLDRYQSKLGLISFTRLHQAAQNWISELKVKTKNFNNPVSSLSGGNQQRVVLAKWLAINPHVMILNGPTVGVDVGSKRDILEIIRDRAEKGMSFIVVSDDIPELLQICHRVIVIKNGKIASTFNESQLDESRIYQELA